MIRTSKIFFIFFIFLLTSCSDKKLTIDEIVDIAAESVEGATDIFDQNDSEDYASSESVAMLEIPPQLDTPDYTSSLKVPRSVSASDDDIKSLLNAPVLPKYLEMEIRKDGIARWLEIKIDPVSLWPYIKRFIEAQGYEIETSNPVTGIIRTNWKEIRRYISSRSKLNDHNENFSEAREKFTARMEREPNGYTKVFLTQQLLEVEGVLKNKKIVWKKANADPSREVEMLVRMMEYFGNTRQESVASFNSSEKESKENYIDLINFEGIPAILLDDTFSRVWREVGLSIDRAGLTVEDYDRQNAIYIVSTKDSLPNYSHKEIEIKITTRRKKHIVTAHAISSKKPLEKEFSRKVLRHILAAYRLNLSLAEIKSDYVKSDFVIKKKRKEEIKELVSTLEPEILSTIEDWRIAWQLGEYEEYISYYINDYFSENFDSHQEWLNNRKENINAERGISIEVSNMSINLIDEKNADIIFRQKYTSKDYKDSMKKEMHLTKINGLWKITKENSL
ncbi:MAG: outer membrane protein assembly factor BamC [Pseudomonadota bacterium]|nr:outer membrane protein assembly factor BamC [Pseudomonadota bacterium]